jgi:hypothetical protein
MNHKNRKSRQITWQKTTNLCKYLRVIAFLSVLIIFSSCATLNVSEINNLERLEFEPLILQPDREVNGLRIDLIRQTRSETGLDSITGTEDVPYHLIGFDLGNGIFYDLNDNLGMRVDYLLGFSDKGNFRVDKYTRPLSERGKTSYTLRNDTMTIATPLRRGGRYLYHIENDGTTESYKYKNRVKYRITETESSLVLAGKRRQIRSIDEITEGHFALRKFWGREDYKISGNEIILDRDYHISLTDDRKAIQIRNKGIRKGRVRYTIERSSDQIFIYNRRFSGRKVEIEGDAISFYKGKRPYLKYVLIRE